METELGSWSRLGALFWCGSRSADRLLVRPNGVAGRQGLQASNFAVLMICRARSPIRRLLAMASRRNSW